MEVELEDDKNATTPEVDELINVLHGAHCDNSLQQYFAVMPGRTRTSIMPVTPFVFEYFLFNSLYQIDWEATDVNRKLIYHPKTIREPQQQEKLLSYLKGHTAKHPESLYRAFEPLLHIETEGSWTETTPSARLSQEEGIKFFRNICNLKAKLKNCQSGLDISTSETIAAHIKHCTDFICDIRNNIFHGSKSLASVRESNQRRRIEVYELFLKGVTSLFFLASGKSRVASDFVPCPLYIRPSRGADLVEILDRELIFDATSQELMKIGDSRLIARFYREVRPPVDVTAITEQSSLFYPSSGTDFLTPLLLGLPYCAKFYFFDVNNSRLPNHFLKVLRKIRGIKLGNNQNWISCGDSDRLDFEYNGVTRQINWVHADNLNIFNRERIELRFYFHRGDSGGEGGSDQAWDSKYLHDLVKLIPSRSHAIYITDGEPGGFCAPQMSKSLFSCPFVERQRTLRWSQ